MYSPLADESAKSSDLVLICVDDSEHSLRAFNWYHDNLYRSTHNIALVHVFTPPMEVPILGQEMNYHPQLSGKEEFKRVVKAEKKKSIAITARYEEMCAERGFECRVFNETRKSNSSSVGDVICEVVREHGVMCVVMGQRGMGAIKRTIYGSVSDHVLHHSHVTVVVVPPPKLHKH